VVQVPSALVGALNGLIVVVVVGSEILRLRQVRRVDRTLRVASTSLSEEEKR
jgi:simple sugar transport system permease protein